MCGIAGAYLEAGAGDLVAALARSAAAIRHRGPDAQGHWLAPGGRLGFAHRRLTIVDLSAAGNQPMASASGRLVICFNGEIYNYQALRQELEARGIAFRSHSDTEVILEAVEAWGLEPALHRFIGMFAFALWDAQANCVYLVRDRVGVKPLYFGRGGSQWAFASEVKALRHYPWLDHSPDREALSLYLRYGYIPAPRSVYQGVRKVPAGAYLQVAIDSGNVTEHHYWSLPDVARAGQEYPYEGTPENAVEELEALLDDSIRLRMIADVPVGAFLSGGIDSSTVVALMRRHSSQPIRTFTIGFREPGSNEAEHAQRVAAHLGTEHQELYVGEADLLRHVDDITRIGDEPFADPSILPTWILSRLAAEHVKVALSGDGGDELFGGYNHYTRVASAQRLNRRLPRALGRTLGELMTRSGASAGKLARKGAMMAATGIDEIATAMLSHWQRPARILRGGTNSDTVFESGEAPLGASLLARLMLRDTIRYLPDDILHKVDRASMAASLEAREPVLDHRVIEFSWRLPLSWRIRDGVTKWPLRQVLARYVPRQLVERPKQGFGVPVSAWLRGELRGWAEDLLADPVLDEFFDGITVRRIWKQRIDLRAGRGGTRLWDVLLLVNWLRHDLVFRSQSDT
ncbi:MAG: asparagine synthase (glutamine-hydrolyzing) [Gammaproteobacteria bacterium]|nr:MAG: asparagine synthase (glutamine-hydrolyzing) [Gammaproteobacteria bacterium]